MLTSMFLMTYYIAEAKIIKLNFSPSCFHLVFSYQANSLAY